MDLGLGNKVAMVAAGTKGIGLAIAQALAGEGCLVSVCARTKPAEKLPDGVTFFAADVSVAEQLADWHRSIGKPIDILVTNTGGPPAGPWHEMSDAHWQTGVEATLMNVVRLVRLVSPEMAERRWGRIVHVTSLVAKEPSPLLAVSSTLRAGLCALTRLQATELAPFGVTVNGLLPGHTMTDRQTHLAEMRAGIRGTTTEAELAAQAGRIPIGRIAEPSEIAAPAVFLCSEQASYVTGVNLLVDGGCILGPG